MQAISKKQLCLGLLAALLAFACCGCGQDAKPTAKAPAKPAAPTQTTPVFKDGVYEGVGQGYADKIKVKVTVKDKKISAIEILSINDSPKAYNKVKDETIALILKKQNPVKVDTVSGASFSSNGIRYAVADALKTQLSQTDMNTILAEAKNNEPIRIKTKAANDERHKNKK